MKTIPYSEMLNVEMQVLWREKRSLLFWVIASEAWQSHRVK